MSDERMKILNMIQEGTISAEEGMKLLDALEESADLPAVPKDKSDSKWVKIIVVEEGEKKVNVTIPVNLVKLGLGIGMKYSGDTKGLENLDLDEIIRQIEEGTEGKIVEVVDGDTRVEVYVE